MALLAAVAQAQGLEPRLYLLLVQLVEVLAGELLGPGQ